MEDILWIAPRLSHRSASDRKSGTAGHRASAARLAAVEELDAHAAAGLGTLALAGLQ